MKLSLCCLGWSADFQASSKEELLAQLKGVSATTDAYGHIHWIRIETSQGWRQVARVSILALRAGNADGYVQTLWKQISQSAELLSQRGITVAS